MPPSHAMGLRWAVAGFAAAALAILVAAPCSPARPTRSPRSAGWAGRSWARPSWRSARRSPSWSPRSRRSGGAYDLAIGNVFGSNSFNVAMLAILDLFHPGSLLHAVAPVHAMTGVAVILVTAVALAGQLYRVESAHPLRRARRLPGHRPRRLRDLRGLFRRM